MEENMQSHIQMPRCVLAEFVNGNKSFYKYNVENGKINIGFPKRTFTSENYYSEAMESALNKHIESPLRTLLDFARILPTLTLPITLEDKVITLARTYIESLVARSPILFSSVNEESDLLGLFSIQDRHDIVVDYAMKNEEMRKFYDRFTLSFMVNETNTPFVLPTRGLYEFQYMGTLCLNAPLNPRCALMLEENNPSKNAESKIAVIPKTFDDILMKINGYALQRQRQDNVGYVVCYDKSILEQLVKSE